MAAGLDLATLVHAHQAGVWRYLRILGCDAALADDMTQETFLAVLEKPFEDYGPAATAAYLRKVAKNLYISLLRRQNRQIPIDNFDEIDARWNDWAQHDGGELYLDALDACLEHLTERARLALELRYRDLKSRPEIAAQLEMSEDGAKNLLQRAKQTLKSCIERRLG